MQVLVELQTIMKYVGYSDFEQLPAARSIGLILRIVGFFSFMYSVITSILYLAIGNGSFDNQLLCVFAIDTSLHNMGMLLVMVITKADIEKTIGRIGALIHCRQELNKHFGVYKKTNDDIERLTDRANLIWDKIIIPLWIVPVFILSFFNYYVRNMGADAFELPTPSM